MHVTCRTDLRAFLGHEVLLSPRNAKSLEQAVGTVVAVRDSGATVRVERREVDVPWAMIRLDGQAQYRSLPGRRLLRFAEEPASP